MRILVTGGGTAGHISPILATVDALKRRDPEVEILYVGSAGGMEAKIARSAGMRFTPIAAGKFRRIHGARLYNKIFNLSTIGLNARDSLRVLRGVQQSLKILGDFNPDVVFVKGGYVGLPVGIAAGIKRIPYVIHESDIEPGLTNRLLSKKAAVVAVGFPTERYKELDKDKLVFVGNAVRPEHLNQDREASLAHFGLDTHKPVILVTGGSQGARVLNDAILEALPELLNIYQVIHLTGEHDIERVRYEIRRMGLSEDSGYRVHSFLLDDMGMALAAADIVVCRAGANTIAELALLAKPTILVPNELMAGHQVANAQMLARAGAARVLPEDRMSPSRLLRELAGITENAEERKRLSVNIGQFGVAGASEHLAAVIMNAARKSTPQEEAQNKAGERG